MLTCKKCFAPCNEGAKFCSNCGNPVSSDEPSVSTGEDVGDLLLSRGEGPGETANRLICPKCKILYERGSTCIRCRSPLVERGASVEKEEPRPSDAVEAKKEMTLLVEAPGFKPEEAKASPKQEIPFEVLGNETPMAEALRDEIPKDEVPKVPPKQNQLRLNQLKAEMVKKGTLRKSKMDRVFHMSFESAKILILVGTAGYLLWSVSSHFFLKKPEAKVVLPKGNDVLVVAATSAGDSAVTDNPSTETLPPQPSLEPSPPISSAAPAGEAGTFEDVRDIFEKIKQGNLAKNIELFMACYSPSFKDREEKRKETLRTWGNFNYYDLSYDLKVCSVSGGIARAKVEWRILFSPKTGGPAEESRTLLNVTLEKKEDGWKILEVKSLS